MSEDKETRQAQENEAKGEAEPGSSQDAGDDAAVAASQAPDEPSGERPPRRGGQGLAWLALLLALAAGALAGWQWWLSLTEGPSPDFASRLDQQRETIESQAGRITQLTQRLGQLESRVDSLSGQLDRLPPPDFDPAELRRQVQSRADADAELQRRVDSLSERLGQAVSGLEDRIESGLERAGAARAGQIEESLAEARYQLALVEVAALLRLGQSRAELAEDVDAAVAAYRQAQSRLEAIDDGRLSALRSLVAEELEALESVETVSWRGLAGRLAALERESGQWPLADVPRQGGEPADGEDSDDGGERGWRASLRDAFSGLVRVTPRDSAPLTPAAAETVRERIRLHLATAQAAAAHRGLDQMKRNLEMAEELIRAHFDTSGESVSHALEALGEAAAVSAPSLPDLGEALAEAEQRLAAP